MTGLYRDNAQPPPDISSVTEQRHPHPPPHSRRNAIPRDSETNGSRDEDPGTNSPPVLRPTVATGPRRPLRLVDEGRHPRPDVRGLYHRPPGPPVREGDTVHADAN
nr:hypothetical protein GCM10020241_06260 [Streptoalloteichus tenebrarius]